ncbi:MAG: TonB-dependent receptor plug domain-containing protein [Bacteroidetes bacterium]|nr:TonB-dependent receptor plug domain-containing protein [Bacteroidota bacterium]
MNQNQEVVDRKKVRIKEGMGHGNITLDKNLPTGVYTLHAYSNWMRNFDAFLLFERKISILSPLISLEKMTYRSDSIVLQFFPEGGYMISGIENKVAFKASNLEGKGKQVSGKIIDQDNNIIQEFESFHKGMGLITINPAPETTYFAEINTGSISMSKYKLPAPVQEEFILSVDNSKADFVYVNLVSTADLPKEIGKRVWLVAQSQGKIFFMTYGSLNKNIKISIPKLSLPVGIIHFTVFDENLYPKAERLIYIKKPPAYSIEITSKKDEYQPRDSVNISIKLTNDKKLPVMANLSLSAVDLNQVNFNYQHAHNIHNYLLLTSELKGYIKDPGFYFDPANEKADQALDILLMTHGWRRYKWEKVLTDNYDEPKYLFEAGINITGKLTNQFKKPISNGIVYMIIQSGDWLFQNAVTDEAGNFGFYNLDISSSTEIIIQGQRKKGNKGGIQVIVDSISTMPNFERNLMEFDENEFINYRQVFEMGKKRAEIEAAFDLSAMNIILEEVVIEATKIDPMTERKSGQLYSNPDTRLIMDDANLSGYLSITDFLRGKVAGVVISGSTFDPKITIRGSTPILLLDGFPTSPQVIASIPITNIETVDILKRPNIYGRSGGVIAIYSKKGSVNKDLVRHGLVNFQPKGYSIIKEFYRPAYNQSQEISVKPDHGATLHWEPFVEIDSTGTTDVSFYNAELETTVLIVVEGITKNGLPVVGRMLYSIKK